MINAHQTNKQTNKKKKEGGGEEIESLPEKEFRIII